MIYHVKRRVRDKFSGVLGYSGTTQTFSPSMSRKKRELNTGLTKEDEKFFEKELGLSAGDLSKQLRPDGTTVSEYWKLYGLEIPTNGLDLNDEIAADALAVKLLHASSLAVNKRGAPHFKAKWEIYSDISEAKDFNVVIKDKKIAYKIYGSMTEAEKNQYLTSIGKEVTNTDPDIIDSLVGNDVETTPKKFVSRMNDPAKKDKAWLYSLLHAKIIKEVGGIIYYNDIQLGINIENAVEWLNLKEEANQKLKLALMKEHRLFYQSEEPVSTVTVEEPKIEEPKDEGKEPKIVKEGPDREPKKVEIK